MVIKLIGLSKIHIHYQKIICIHVQILITQLHYTEDPTVLMFMSPTQLTITSHKSQQVDNNYYFTSACYIRNVISKPNKMDVFNFT